MKEDRVLKVSVDEHRLARFPNEAGHQEVLFGLIFFPFSLTEVRLTCSFLDEPILTWPQPTLSSPM